jgi:hypothetical protein
MAGKPGVKMPCGWNCGGSYTAVEMREHFTICPKRPKRIKAATKRLKEFAERKHADLR